MADTDKIFKILIEYGLNDDAAKQAAADLVKLKEGTSEAGKETEKLTIKHGDLHKMLRILGGSFGELGHLIHFVLSPWVLLTAAVAMGIKGITEANEFLKRSIEAVSTSVGNMRQAWEDVQLEAIKADKTFEEKQTKWKRDTATRISLIHSERDAIKERMKALEVEEIAKAKTDDEKSGIKKRYEGAEKELDTRAQIAELGVKQAEIDQLNLAMLNRLDHASKVGGGRSPEQIEAVLKNFSGVKADAKNLAEEEKKLAEEIKPGFWENLLMRGSDSGSPLGKLLANRQDQFETHETLGQRAGRMAEGQFPREKSLTEAQTDFAAADRIRKELADKEAEMFRTRAGMQMRHDIAGSGPQMFGTPHLSQGGDFAGAAERFARRDFEQLFAANQNPGALNPNQAGMIAQLLSAALGHQVKVNEVGKGLAEYFATQRSINAGYDNLLRDITREIKNMNGRIAYSHNFGN